MTDIQMIVVCDKIVQKQKMMQFIKVNRENLTKGWAKRNGRTIHCT